LAHMLASFGANFSSAQQTNSNQSALIVGAHQSRPPSAACGRYQGGPLARTQAGVNKGRQNNDAHGNQAPWAIYSNSDWKCSAIGRDCCERECAHGGVEKSGVSQARASYAGGVPACGEGRETHHIIPSTGTTNSRTDAQGNVGATDAREADKAAGVHTGRVEEGPSADSSPPPSSNRTCGFPASGFPITFTV
jgi:hypothetical protein